MSERIFIGVAWPYANNSLHLGHIAGAYLPPDIFARYHRMKGSDVLMVSGSDTHGTPITIRAEQEGKQPAEIVARYHKEFLECWQKLGISFDFYTSTSTENHAQVAQDIFTTLLDKGHIFKETTKQAYCASCRRFLPDRYVEGICPYCDFSGARGDQCDQCGKPLSAAELADPRCSICGGTPEFRDTEHFFLRLSAFEDKLISWAGKQNHWRRNVRNFTRRYLHDGLKDRAITRDISWGIPLPLPGYEGKRLYVWFEAVIGYLSASKEWAKAGGDAEAWRPYWQGDTKSYYFIGKDNIPFHTIVWPAILMGYGDLNLPYDVPANEYLTFEGAKLSSSRDYAVWLPDFLSRYDPDSLRYLLSANMPETGDTDFSWREFVRRNNDELVATYGNLAQRTLTFTHRHFEGSVPPAGELDERSRELLEQVEKTLKDVDELLYACHFKEAIKRGMSLAHEANRYLEEKSPWKVVKKDRAAAATALYVVLGVLSCLRIVFYPFLPFSSQRLHEMLGFSGKVEDEAWRLRQPEPGQKLPQPQPLFKKLDEDVVIEEAGRQGQ